MSDSKVQKMTKMTVEIKGLQDYQLEHILFDLNEKKTMEVVQCLKSYENNSKLLMAHISGNYLRYNDLLKCGISMQKCIDEIYLTNYTTNIVCLFNHGITIEYLEQLEKNCKQTNNINIKLYLIQNYTRLIMLMDDHVLNTKNIVDINNLDSRLFKILIDNYSDVIVYLKLFTLNEVLAKYLVIIKNRS